MIYCLKFIYLFYIITFIFIIINLENGPLNKEAKFLYYIKNPEVTEYDKGELITLLANKKIHSPEISKTDEKTSVHNIYVYNLSWRSNRILYLIFIFFVFLLYCIWYLHYYYFYYLFQLKNLLCHVLNLHALTLQTSQLIKPRNYNDKINATIFQIQ